MKLAISSLGKQYRRDFWGLKDFSLEVHPGILGLLGPNGAGKSTFMRMLATITQPTQGSIFWDDVDIVKSPDVMRAVLGYLPQDFGVYPHLNAVEFLEYMAAIKGLDSKSSKKRIAELLQVVNLADAAKRPLDSYSGGMKHRVGIAQALLNDPQLLIVDEPTVGLDPEERVRFRNLLSDLSGERIVILSTINKGRLLRDAQPEDLLKELDGKVWKWTVSSVELPTLKQEHVIGGTIRRSEGVEIRVVSSSQPNAQAANVPPNLEDAYLFLMTCLGNYDQVK